VQLLRLIPSLDPAAGGPAQGIRQMSPLLAARGVSTSVVSLDPPDSSWLAAEHCPGFSAVGLGPGRGVYGYRPGLPQRLQPLLRDAEAMVIHGLWQYHALAAWRAWRRLGSLAPPYWVYTHGMLDPWFRRRYPLKHLKKCLYWPWADQRVLRDARAVLFTTEQECRLARGAFWPYRLQEQVVPYGIMPPPDDATGQIEAFDQAYPQLSQRPFLLALSRLHEKKGLDLLLQAFAGIAEQAPELQLVLAGPDGGMRASLIRQAASLGLSERVHVLGLLLGEIKWGALRRCELFCLPSHQENFGLVVAEALACSRPVLISTAVNLCCEVERAGAGLVQPDDLPSTVMALRRWLHMESCERAAMAVRARALFDASFDLTMGAEQFIALLSAPSRS
jgi:glycosyltransferase involved in cell wall biosynthesis